MEFDYIIYNAFDATIAALLKIALIYSHDDYGTLIFIAAVCGIALGAIVALGKAAVDGKSNILTFIIPAVLGMIIYIALIGPRGTLHVYDSGTNQYQALDLPEIIVFIAGTTNYVENALINIIDDTTSYPTSNSSYRSDSGGLSFNMLNDAIDVIKVKRSRYFKKSLEEHIDNCLAPALMDDGAFSIDDLDNEDILNAWDSATTIYNGNTTWYDDLNRGGTTVTCSQSITNIQNEFNDLSANEATVSEVCLKAGFNVGTPALLNQCRQLIESKSAIGTSSLDLLLQNAFLTAATMNALKKDGNFQDSITVYSNRNQQTANIGAGQVANDWIPVIRAVVVAVTFGLTPLVGLFVVTPLFFRVLLFVTGMFIWLSTWSVVDALIHSLALDLSLKVFDGMVDGTIGMNEIIYMPDALEKAAGIFAKSRTMGVTISTVIMYSLFKFGGMALASMGGRFTDNAQAAGERAGMTAATAEGRGQAISGAVGGTAQQNNLDHHGQAAMTNAATYTQSTQISGANQAMSRFTAGDPSADAAHRTASAVGNYNAHQVSENIGAGEAKDSVNKVEGVTSQHRGFMTAYASDSGSYGDSKGTINASQQSNQTVAEMKESIAINTNATNAASATVSQNGADMTTNGNVYTSKLGSSSYETSMTGAEVKDSPMFAGKDMSHLDDNTAYKVSATSSDGSLNPESLSNATVMNQTESGSKTTRNNSDITNAGANSGEWHSVWGENGSREQQKQFLDKARNDEAFEVESVDALTSSSKTLSEGTLSQSDSKSTNAQIGLSKLGSGMTTNLQYRSDDGTRISAEGVENRDKFGEILDTLNSALDSSGGDTMRQQDAYDQAIAATQDLYDANSTDKVEGNAPQVAEEKRGPSAGTGNNSDLSQIETALKERLSNFIDGAGGIIGGWVAAADSKEELNEIAMDNAVQDYEQRTGEPITQELRERLGELVPQRIDEEINNPEQDPLIQEKYNKMK